MSTFRDTLMTQIKDVQAEIKEVKAEIKTVESLVDTKAQSFQEEINSSKKVILDAQDHIEGVLTDPKTSNNSKLHAFLLDKVKGHQANELTLRKMLELRRLEFAMETKLLRERLWNKETELQQKKTELEQQLNDFLRAQQDFVRMNLEDEKTEKISEITDTALNELIKHHSLGLDIIDLKWELPSSFDRPEDPISRFAWDSAAENNKANYDRYLVFLHNFIQPQGHNHRVMKAPKNFLSSVNAFGRFSGTTDVIIVPKGTYSNAVLETKIAGIIELKKPEEAETISKPHQAQAVLEHILAMIKSEDQGVLTCLTDLQDNWILYWLSRHGTVLYKLHTGIDEAYGLLRNMFTTNDAANEFPKDFCNRGTWVAHEAYMNAKETSLVTVEEGEDDDPNEEDGEAESDKSPPDGGNNETPPGANTRNDASGKDAHDASGTFGSDNVTGFGMEESIKIKLEHAQGDVMQRDSDRWAGRMKFLDTGADVANELDLLEMLDNDKDRQDIIAAVAHRRYVLPNFPELEYEISKGDSSEDGHSVLTAANLERHLASSGSSDRQCKTLYHLSSQFGRDISQ